MIAAAALLALLAPPPTPVEPAPEPAETGPPAADSPEPDAAPAPEKPPAKQRPAAKGPEVDSRGYPVLDYAESPQDPAAELGWAEETPPPPELEYGESQDPGAALEHDESVQHATPAPAALERQGPAGLSAQAKARRPTESPQRFALELKFGPYLPGVDRAYDGPGRGPYASIYGKTDDAGNVIGDPPPGIFTALAFDWQFIYLAGPLSIGTSIGFFRDTAQALIADPEPGGPVRSEADNTSFNVVPVTLLAGYRFELMADRIKVPFVPYAKGGLAYGFWWSTDGNGKVSENSRGEKGRGGSVGWQAQAGLMLRLDFIERGSARTLDRITGINHTYLFGEYQFSRLTGFGRGNRVDVGADTWLVGLAMEF